MRRATHFKWEGGDTLLRCIVLVPPLSCKVQKSGHVVHTYHIKQIDLFLIENIERKNILLHLRALGDWLNFQIYLDSIFWLHLLLHDENIQALDTWCFHHCKLRSCAVGDAWGISVLSIPDNINLCTCATETEWSDICSIQDFCKRTAGPNYVPKNDANGVFQGECETAAISSAYLRLLSSPSYI